MASLEDRARELVRHRAEQDALYERRRAEEREAAVARAEHTVALLREFAELAQKVGVPQTTVYRYVEVPHGKDPSEDKPHDHRGSVACRAWIIKTRLGEKDGDSYRWAVGVTDRGEGICLEERCRLTPAWAFPGKWRPRDEFKRIVWFDDGPLFFDQKGVTILLSDDDILNAATEIVEQHDRELKKQ